jgi:hypothetical protein
VSRIEFIAPRSETLLGSPQFGELLKRLEKSVVEARAKELDELERTLLRQWVAEAVLLYEGIGCGEAQTAQCTLHEIAEPLRRVGQHLTTEANLYHVLVALGAPPTMRLSPNDRALDRALRRYDALMRDLAKIARAVPKPPDARLGRPVETKDLWACANVLAAAWERLSGQPFTRSWEKANGHWVPGNAGTGFVYDAVELIDSSRLGELNKITRNIVTARPQRFPLHGNDLP